MSFEVSGDAYDRFIGEWSAPLADGFLDFAGIDPAGPGDSGEPGDPADPAEPGDVLDVGCGPGALTGRLVDRLGAGSVKAVDPSSSFVATVRERHPGLDVREASAESLPFADATFAAALAQLVVHFMSDPVAGLREMARVTTTGGVVAACVWDHAGTTGPLAAFWQAAVELDPGVRDESALAGAREGHLVELATQAGLLDVRQGSLEVRRHYTSYDEWWQPYTLGVGPAGAYLATLDDASRAALRRRAVALLPPAPFTLVATAWAARGRVA